MKSVIFASIIATAAAFAPAQQKATSTAVKAFEDELGVQVRCRLSMSQIALVSDFFFDAMHSLTNYFTFTTLLRYSHHLDSSILLVCSTTFPRNVSTNSDTPS